MRELLVMGDQTGALQDFLAAIREDPSLAEFRDIRSFAVRRAMPDANKEEMNPLLLEAARIYASRHTDEWAPIPLLVELSTAEAADKLLSDWLASHPSDPDALSLRAQTRIRRKQYEAAVADWEKLIALDPDDPSRQVEVGSAIVEAVGGDPKMAPALKARLVDRAQVALRRATKLDPQSATAVTALMSTLRLKAAAASAADQARITAEADALNLRGVEMWAKAGLPKTIDLRIRQGMTRFAVKDRDVVKLERGSFTLEYNLDENVPVWVQVSTTDATQRLTERGVDRPKVCKASTSWAFCAGNLVSAPHNAGENLEIGPRIWNHLYYASEADHTWSQAPAGGLGAYRRVVSKIGGVPLTSVKENRLFFTSVEDLDGDGRIDPGEYQRFTIVF